MFQSRYRRRFGRVSGFLGICGESVLRRAAGVSGLKPGGTASMPSDSFW
jgi:hypothetical protein